MNDRVHSRFVCVLAACLMLAACGSDTSGETEESHRDATRERLAGGLYKPGMGDLMNVLQLRHAKLWYAGEAENWALAAFELHEIEETFERVARWHPEEDGMPVGPALEGYMHGAREALETSVANKDSAAFETAFDRFTEGCNACHRAMKHEFIVIQRPTREPVSNQRWDETP